MLLRDLSTGDVHVLDGHTMFKDGQPLFYRDPIDQEVFYDFDGHPVLYAGDGYLWRYDHGSPLYPLEEG